MRPKPEARHVIFHSYDGYTTNVTLDVFAETDVLLAHGWEGKPLPRDHGGPVRMVVPQWYFWKSAKWVNRIEFVAKTGRASGKCAVITTKAIRGKKNGIAKAFFAAAQIGPLMASQRRRVYIVAS